MPRRELNTNHHRGNPPEVLERAARIREAFITGLPPEYVADSLGVTVKTVQRHYELLRCEGVEQEKK